MPRLLPMIIALVAIGLLYRLWPIASGMPALANFFLTEDGYLMLTVSRNMALGAGMSVSDGTIPTNGVQPLIAFIFTIPYLATGADKVTSLVGIHLIHAVTALAALFAIRGLAARILAPGTSPVWPWAAALLWFLSPLLLRHSMNGLETGLYTLVLVLTLLVFARVLEAGEAASRRLTLGLGAMCGLAVLARNDAVFFVTALFAVWAAMTLFVQRQSFRAMLVKLVPAGLLSIIVAAPWLINNKLRFGSIVPVSGTAQSADATFGQNAPLLPATLFEYTFPMLPVPGAIETNPALMGVAALATAIALVFLLLRVFGRQGSPVARALVLAFLGHAAALAFYYGYFFGAAHFLSRYLAPVAPLLIIAALAAALELGRLVVRSRPDVLAWAYTGVGVGLSVALLARALLPGVTLQGHEQVVTWVEDNVSQQTWVGAVQTGTLGYWHDRTYNLDGKVNPEALAARLTEGHVLNYVTKSDIAYVIDWAGVGDWVNFPQAEGGFADAFELILQDQQANLSVMQRKN